MSETKLPTVKPASGAILKLIEAESLKATVDRYYELREEALGELRQEFGYGRYFQFAGTMYQVVAPDGHYVTYRHTDVKRTRREGEKGSDYIAAKTALAVEADGDYVKVLPVFDYLEMLHHRMTLLPEDDHVGRALFRSRIAEFVNPDDFMPMHTYEEFKAKIAGVPDVRPAVNAPLDMESVKRSAAESEIGDLKDGAFLQSV
jgi:hypothetical protein